MFSIPSLSLYIFVVSSSNLNLSLDITRSVLFSQSHASRDLRIIPMRMLVTDIHYLFDGITTYILPSPVYRVEIFYSRLNERCTLSHVVSVFISTLTYFFEAYGSPLLLG